MGTQTFVELWEGSHTEGPLKVALHMGRQDDAVGDSGRSDAGDVRVGDKGMASILGHHRDSRSRSLRDT